MSSKNVKISVANFSRISGTWRPSLLKKSDFWTAMEAGKHTVFVYIAYIFSIVVLLLGYYFPHYALKKEIRIKNDKNNKNK